MKSPQVELSQHHSSPSTTLHLLFRNWYSSRLSTRTTSVFTLDHSAFTSNGFSYNCSSLFPHPQTPTLQHASQNVWQTSLLGQLCTTSSSAFIKLNSSASQEKSLLRVSQYHLHQLQGTWALSSMTILHPQHQRCCPILQICPLQHPQALVKTTQHNSWSKH